MTNLRVIWFSLANTRFTLCNSLIKIYNLTNKITKFFLAIGFFCILNVDTKKSNSKLRGPSESLQILATTKKQRYTFLFTDLVIKTIRHFTSVFDVYRIYQSTLLYRELKVRGANLTDDQLNVLPYEKIYNRLNSMYNLSDTGNIGAFSKFLDFYYVGFRLQEIQKFLRRAPHEQMRSNFHYDKLATKENENAKHSMWCSHNNSTNSLYCINVN